jgi:hypothetical protein
VLRTMTFVDERPPVDVELDRLVREARGLSMPPGPGLIVAREEHGAMTLSGSTSWSDWNAHAARYLVSDQYAPQFCRGKGEPYDADAWLDALLTTCSRDALLHAITAGTRVARVGGGALDEWTTHVLNVVEASLSARMREALVSGDGGPTRVFLARQPLLLALKLSLSRPPPARPGTGDPFVVATLLSHHAAREPVRARRPLAGAPRIGGLPEPLAMEVVANTLFNLPVEFGDLLARTELIWSANESRLARTRPRLPLEQMLIEAVGLGLDDLLTVAFALFAHAAEASVAGARQLDLSSLGLPQATIDAFLARFAATESELTALLGKQQGEWAFLPLEDSPLLRVGRSTVIVIDETLLQRRFTSGLYWLVHDHEKRIDEQDRRAWTQVYSELVEIHAEDIVQRLAPPVLGGSAFFTEEQLAKLGGSAVDCGIDFGDVVLLADVVQHQMTVPTRMMCEPKSFEADMRATVLKKVKQLDGSIRRLLDKPNHPDHPLGRRPARILPLVVQGADFPVNPVTVRHARTEANKLGLLEFAECAPLIIVTLDELEAMDALLTSTTAAARDIFVEYSGTGAENSLRNFIVERFGGSGLHRSGPIQDALDRVLGMVMKRLDPSGP